MHKRSKIAEDALLIDFDSARSILGNPSKDLFAQLLRSGQLPVVRLSSRCVRIPRKAVEEFVARSAAPWSRAE